MPPSRSTKQSHSFPFDEPTSALLQGKETDPEYLPVAGSLSDEKPGFRHAHLQEAVGLADPEFANFKTQIHILMDACFDIDLTLTEQPHAMGTFRKTLLHEFPTVLGGDTEEKKMSLVNTYIQRAHGFKRHQKKIKRRDAGNAAGHTVSRIIPFPEGRGVNQTILNSQKRSPSAAQCFLKAGTRHPGPSIGHMSSPTAGIPFPSASDRRRKVGSGTGATTLTAPQALSTHRPKSMQRPLANTHRPTPTSPIKERRCPSLPHTSTPPSLVSSSLSSPFDAHSSTKEDIISRYVGSPALEEAGILFFLSSCNPSMEEFLPAFVAFGCTLPKMKIVSAWPPEDVDAMWVTKLRETVGKMRGEQDAERQMEFKMSGRWSSGRVDRTSLEGGSVKNGGSGEVSGLRDLTLMDGIILAHYLKEFWKTRC